MKAVNKTPFSGNLNEKAYLLGLRTGDIHARKHYRLIQADTTSTKDAQLKMFAQAFRKYGQVKSYKKKGGYTETTNRIYTFLDLSFDFLTQKPKIIPSWIMKNNGLFYSFLAGYVDSEGSWIITHHKLKELGYNSHFYLVRKKGTYGNRVCNFDLYRVMIMSHKDVVKLAETLLPLSLHDDKKSMQSAIINYNLTNIENKLIKKQNLGTIKINCPKCNNKRVWKNGFSRWMERRYPRYKCPQCKSEFQKAVL